MSGGCNCASCKPPSILPQKRLPSIVAGRLERVSVSQIKTSKLCRRKWWYDKAAGLDRKAPSKKQDLGTAGHTRLQHTANTREDVRGEMEDVEPAASRFEELTGIYSFDHPQVYAEHEIEGVLTTPGGVPFIGSIDLLVIDADGIPAIVDHKFRGDITADYVETAESLRDEPQMIVYAAYVMTRWAHVEEIRCEQHNYQHTGPKRSSVVGCTFTREEVLSKFADLCAWVDSEMQSDAATDLHTDVIDNGAPAGCRAFGGCDFNLICPSAPQRSFALSLIPGYKSHEIRRKPSAVIDVNAVQPAAQEQQTMGLLTKLAAEERAATQTVDVVPVQPPPTSTRVNTVTAVPEAGNLYITPKGEGRCEAVTPNAIFFESAKGEPIKCAPGDAFVDITNDASARKIFGLPPLEEPKAEKPRRLVVQDIPSSTNAGQVLPPGAPPAPKNPEEFDRAMAAEQGKPVEAAAEAPPAPAEPEKKRGRPAKSVAVSEAERAASTQPAGIVLLINAFTPGAEDLSKYVDTVSKRVSSAFKVPDVRLGEKDSALAFGRWPAVLGAAVREQPPAPGIYFVERGQLADPVIEALIPLCSMVVRGV